MVKSGHTLRLSDELANSRAQLRDRLLLLRRDLDVGRHIVHSMGGHTFEWITVAFISGWLLSRLPAQKKRFSTTLQIRSRARAVAIRKRTNLGRRYGILSNP